MKLPPGAGSWATVSDRSAKANFARVDGRDVLAKLSAIPMETWNYKSEGESVRHMGPTAQDFSAAFGLGPDNKTIATIDADGVALAAIQALHKMVEEQAATIAELKAELAAQKNQGTGGKR